MIKTSTKHKYSNYSNFLRKKALVKTSWNITCKELRLLFGDVMKDLEPKKERESRKQPNTSYDDNNLDDIFLMMMSSI